MLLLPDLKGIYREDLLAFGESTEERRPPSRRYFLTHDHADYTNYASFLKEDIPFYMGSTTKKVVESPRGREEESEARV